MTEKRDDYRITGRTPALWVVVPATDAAPKTVMGPFESEAEAERWAAENVPREVKSCQE